MRKVEHRLRLDLLRGGNQGYIRVKRGENGARRLAIALYMHSVPYMADAGTTAVFRAIKPDNTKLFNSTTITDNVVTVGLTTQTVAALGTVRCELSIYGTNNELLYSPQFDIIVEDYLYSDTAVESTDEYTELTEAISKVNNIVSTEAARVAAENQRVANETARVSAEAERVSAETARAEAETARATAETERASAETTRASAESSRAFSENIRKQAEKQRVSSETQRDTAETARSTAESGRRSAETARVQEFNAIKADAQDAATAEATRATNEAARVAAEANRANAEQLRVALYNLWNNATASAYGSLSPSVTLSNKDGHKHFNFGIPSNSRERYEIEAGELESTALNFTGFTFYNIWEPDLEWDANISSYGLPSGINKSFVLITGPAEITEDGNIDRSWDVPQTIFDGQNIYIRRLGVSHEGLGSEDDPLVVSYYNKDWEPVGGSKDAVTYTPQTLTEEQKSQARTNIGAEKAGTGYTKPASGIPKTDLEQSVQTSLDKADTAISLGLTAATPGQIIKVKAVQDGKPTEWEAVDMPGGDWELIAHINVADDVEKDVTVWQYNNLPRYKCIAYKKVNLVGSSEQSYSGCFITINNESGQTSGMTYGKLGAPYSCIGIICVMPFGWTHCKTGDSNNPTNYSFGGVSAMYNALPLSDNAITSIELSANPIYKIASGEIWLYGKKG
nr:MAG TPA: Baseplate component [Bacteriophage sp.]